MNNAKQQMTAQPSSRTIPSLDNGCSLFKTDPRVNERICIALCTITWLYLPTALKRFTTKLNEEMCQNSSLHQPWNACHDFIPQGMKNTEEILKISSAKGTPELGGKQQFSAILSRPSCTYYGILSPLKVSEHVWSGMNMSHPPYFPFEITSQAGEGDIALCETAVLRNSTENIIFL